MGQARDRAAAYGGSRSQGGNHARKEPPLEFAAHDIQAGTVALGCPIERSLAGKLLDLVISVSWNPGQQISGDAIKTVNLKSDLPPVHEALQRLERELAVARNEGIAMLKIVHGYGSSGVGGDIRIAVQKRLRQLVDDGQIHACILGENWSTSDEHTWRLVQRHPELKGDRDLGRANHGISIIVLEK